MKAIVVRVEESERVEFLKRASESLFGSGNAMLRAFILSYNASFPKEEAKPVVKPKGKKKRPVAAEG